MQTRRGRFAVAASAPFCSLRALSLRPSLLSILPARSLIRIRSLSLCPSVSLERVQVGVRSRLSRPRRRKWGTATMTTSVSGWWMRRR